MYREKKLTLPDVETRILDYGLGRTGKIKSGTFAIIGFSPAESMIHKITSPEDAINVLGYSSLRDTLLDFFSYAQGTVYCYPINLEENKTTYTYEYVSVYEGNDQSGFTVEVKGNLYKNLESNFYIEIFTSGAENEATFVVKYENKTTKPEIISNKEVPIEELGVSVKITITSSDNKVKEGNFAIVKPSTEFKIEPDKLEEFHKAVVGIQDIVEFLAYDFDSDSSHWTQISSYYQDFSDSYKKEYFGVAKFRNMKLGEATQKYIEALKKEREKPLSSFRVLVLGQPVFYSNYSNFLERGIPFGYFLAKLSTTPYYESINAIIPENQIPGITTLDPFSLEDIDSIYKLSYTGFRYVEGFRGIYLTEAKLLVDENSDFDCVERIRIMTRASFVARNALMGSFINRNFFMASTGEDDGLSVLLKEIIGKAFTTHLSGAFSDYEIEIRGLENAIKTQKIQIFYRIVPLIKIKEITNIFTYSLPKAS